MPEASAKKEVIRWQAPEYEFRKKTADWFWSVGIITLALALSAVFLKNFLVVLMIILGGFSLALYGARKPKTVSFEINPRGIVVGKRIYYYDDLKSFWIHYDPPEKKELAAESKKTFMPHIKIMLGDTDPEEIRRYLLSFLKEEKIEESLMETISRMLGF